MSTELFSTGMTTDRKLAIVGAFAVGIYVEAPYRDVPRELGPLGLTSGLTCRLPFMVAGG